MRHHGPISGIACHPSGFVATAGYDNQVILWDAASRKPLARSYHDHLANQCTFTPDGKHVVSASSDYSARLWSVPEMRLEAVYLGHTDDIEMTAVHPDGMRLATCSRDMDIRTFRLDGVSIARMQGHEADVISVCWEDESDVLISSSDDGTVRRWNGMSGELLETVDLGGVETDTIVITESGTVFAGNDDGEILTIRGGGIEATEAHAAGIKRLAYAADSRQVVSLSYDRKLMIWRIGEGDAIKKVHEAELPSMVWPRSVAFQDADTLVFGTFGSTYAIYDRRGEVWTTHGIDPDISLNAVVSHEGTIYAIGDAGHVMRDGQMIGEIGSLCNFLLPFGPMILTGGQIGTVFDARTGKAIHQHRSPLNVGATFVKDGVEHAVIGAYTGEGIVFRLTPDGSAEHVTDIQLDENAIKGLACSDEYIFSVCATGAATFCRISDFSLVPEFASSHDKIANSCTALPNGKFASVSRDLTLRIWDGAEVEVHPAPLKNSIKCVAASNDGRYLAAGSYGGQIAIFDVAGKSWTSVERPTAAGISNIAHAASADGFVASSYDGRIVPRQRP